MKKLFTTYSIASKLKELGFDEPCLMYYYKDDENKLHSNVSTCTLRGAMISEEENIVMERQIKAPLWQQAIHWLLNYIQNDQDILLKVTIFADNSYIVDSIVNNIDYHFVLHSNQDLLNKLLEL